MKNKLPIEYIVLLLAIVIVSGVVIFVYTNGLHEDDPNAEKCTITGSGLVIENSTGYQVCFTIDELYVIAKKLKSEFNETEVIP